MVVEKVSDTDKVLAVVSVLGKKKMEYGRLWTFDDEEAEAQVEVEVCLWAGIGKVLGPTKTLINYNKYKDDLSPQSPHLCLSLLYCSP